MKHVTIIIAYLLLFSNVSVAQYSINKKKYDYRTYTFEVGDPYNTGVAGVTSLLLPGLGQMISGENGRGAAFLVGYIGCWGIFYAGGRLAGSTMDNNTIANGIGIMLIGAVAAFSVDIWSVVDAIRVTKVNNLAWRDKNSSSYKFQIQPYIFSSDQYSNTNPKVGLSVKLNF